MDIELKDFTKLSTNKIYAGIHYRQRFAYKEDYLLWFSQYRSALKPFKNKVDIHFDYYWKTRALDSSNCSYMSKMIEDCMVHYEILKNDTKEYVGKFSMESHKGDRKYDYCVMRIKESLEKELNNLTL